jgi:hypothetical protein
MHTQIALRSPQLDSHTRTFEIKEFQGARADGSRNRGAGVNSGTHSLAEPRDAAFTFVEKLHPPEEDSARAAPALDRMPAARLYR